MAVACRASTANGECISSFSFLVLGSTYRGSTCQRVIEADSKLSNAAAFRLADSGMGVCVCVCVVCVCVCVCVRERERERERSRGEAR